MNTGALPETAVMPESVAHSIKPAGSAPATSAVEAQVPVPPLAVDDAEALLEALLEAEELLDVPPTPLVAVEPPAPEVALVELALVVSAVDEAVVSVLLQLGLSELDTVPVAPVASQ